ncbi:hypothetical protein [Bradyrhizobium sp. dw_78]|uniref:hypothetical protein n=1 Tax=Bradyrhizobium sp. dw_78 TaxID=2719793 RepID=UPI001BD28D3A|nr:hypothetical protein [Bradyrhizobium sp. dw_78]
MIAKIMLLTPSAMRGAEDLRVRSTITTLLLVMIAVMIVRDVLTRRRNRLRARARRDISFAVR